MDIAEKWTYVCSGFDWLDKNHPQNQSRSKLAKEELCYWIRHSLKNSDALIESLDLEKSCSFSEVPDSFRIMLQCDLDYLASDSAAVLNEEYGSVMMWFVYDEIARQYGADRTVPNTMLQMLEEHK